MALGEPAAPRRMLVIINPVASKMNDRIKSLVVYALQGRYDVTTVETQAKGDGIALSRQAAADGYDVVLAFGGDGTVNELANGLAGTETALTCLPGGNNNVVAKLLGIPTDPSTRPSTCCTWPTTGRHAPSTSARSTGVSSPSPPAWAWTRASSSAWTATRA